MDEQHMVILAPASYWKRRAEEGMDAIEQANGGVPPERFADADKIDHAAFAQVVEALVALEPLTGAKVGDDLISLAGLRPVDEAI